MAERQDEDPARWFPQVYGDVDAGKAVNASAVAPVPTHLWSRRQKLAPKIESASPSCVANVDSDVPNIRFNRVHHLVDMTGED